MLWFVTLFLIMMFNNILKEITRNKSKLHRQNSWLKYTQIRFHAAKYEYHIPQLYQNAFYLANASLEDNINWFLHNAISVIYSELTHELQAKGHTISESKKYISNVINLLEPCNNLIDLKFPVKRNNEEYEIFRGFRAEHGVYITQGPCLGGLRLCENIVKSDITALASLATYKHACLGIDMLGAHGGIVLSPQKVTQQELQKIIESYASILTIKGFCGDAVDIFEPDIKCGQNEIMWITAANSKIKGNFGNICAVGKPIQFGGIKNRKKAVAQGVMIGLDIFIQNSDIMKKINLEVGWRNKTFVLQGLANVGSHIALYLNRMNMKCLGIVENDCYIYDKKSININEALSYKNKNGSLSGFKSRTKYIDPSSVLMEECDMLVLAAVQNSVPYHIADKIKAKIIVEAADGAICPTLYKTLVARHKLVLPDIFINAGSSLASYFEYLKNLQNFPTKNSERFKKKYFGMLKLIGDTSKNQQQSINDKQSIRHMIVTDQHEKCIVTKATDEIMVDTAKVIIATAAKYKLGLDFRTAAYINAIKKLFWTAYNNLKIS